jgi:hypothetical protein
MLIDKVKAMKPLDQFIYWIVERHSIYLKKSAKEEKPWTDDKVLQSYFFTNPWREHDKVTKWFKEHIRDPLHKDQDIRVIFATVLFRWFTLPETGRLLMLTQPGTSYVPKPHFGVLHTWNEAAAVNALFDFQKSGNKVFTGAYNISASGSTKPKVLRVCEDYVTPVWQDRASLENRMTECKTLQEAQQILMKYPGLGGSGFMSYEIVSDLRYTFVLNQAKDINTWANPGPGAIRGMNRLTGRPVDAPMTKREWLELAVELRTTLLSPKHFPKLKPAVKLSNPIDMRVIEHSLCEYDKYVRAMMNDGHMKRTYNGAM